MPDQAFYVLKKLQGRKETNCLTFRCLVITELFCNRRINLTFLWKNFTVSYQISVTRYLSEIATITNAFIVKNKLFPKPGILSFLRQKSICFKIYLITYIVILLKKFRKKLSRAQLDRSAEPYNASA